jgi:Tfp pilus assembly protein PilP
MEARRLLERIAYVYSPGGIKGIRGEVRAEARGILRHFPLPFEICVPEYFSEKEVDAWMKEWRERTAKTRSENSVSPVTGGSAEPSTTPPKPTDSESR